MNKKRVYFSCVLENNLMEIIDRASKRSKGKIIGLNLRKNCGWLLLVAVVIEV